MSMPVRYCQHQFCLFWNFFYSFTTSVKLLLRIYKPVQIRTWKNNTITNITHIFFSTRAQFSFIQDLTRHFQYSMEIIFLCDLTTFSQVLKQRLPSHCCKNLRVDSYCLSPCHFPPFMFLYSWDVMINDLSLHGLAGQCETPVASGLRVHQTQQLEDCQ